MASGTGGRAVGPPVEEHAVLAGDLDAAVSGEVRFDEYAQVLYATDGSIYGARPAGVVFPEDTADVVSAVGVAADHDVPLLPRGAGSSLAGQAVGPGCVVLDLSRHMDAILDVDPAARTATVQPGVVQDHLDTALERHGLKFAPDPASSNRATIGGSIGNNSTGAHSVRYGITDAYTEELEVVLADGSRIETREVVLDSPEYEAIVAKDDRESRIYQTVRQLVEDNHREIEDRYPDLKRSVSGYNLQKVVYTNTTGETVINLSKLFVGAEGTLGIVVAATLSLVPVPERTALGLYCFDSLGDAMEAVPTALEFDPSAVELMDAEVFRLANESQEFAQYAEPIPSGTAAALLLEFDSERREDLTAALDETTTRFVDDGAAFDVLVADTPGKQRDIWKLRKAAIPLLMSLQGDAKPYPFIEDATVPPAELAAYVQEFERILDRHDTSAAYFAHAGSGTLHIRPILSLKHQSGIDTMRSIADDVTDLVVDRDGALSGEHGDGLARTEFNPKMYGADLWAAFKTLKTAFDPAWRLNPGKVVYRDDPDDPGPDTARGVGADMRGPLRYGAAYASIEPATALDFSPEGGFSHLVELCNGCGTCRQMGSDVMCPTYRASREEIQSTRGRANLLRAAISGDLPEGELYTDRFQTEVLDLCVGCKGCQSDCPTGVDMAKLKAEVKYEYHARTGSSRRDRLFANVGAVSAWGSRLAPLSNVVPKIPGSRILLERLLGIARHRSLPSFRRETFRDWFEARGGPRVPESTAADRVLLFPDPYTNYSYPEPGKAAVEVLEAADVHVRLPETPPSGRAAFSLGFLDEAKERARQNVATLGPRVDSDWSVVFVEPSAAVMFQDEYADLLDDEEGSAVRSNAYGICEYLDVNDVASTLDAGGEGLIAYHGHCNQKAIRKDHHAAAVLTSVGYDVDVLDTTCCGMAGSFGYEAEHYDLSMAIADLLFKTVAVSDADEVVAPGASCRTQVADGQGDRPAHPIEKVAVAIQQGG